MRRRSVVRVRKTEPGFTEDGDRITAPETRTTVPQVLLAPRYEDAGDVTGTARSGVIVGYRMYTRPGVDLVHTDQIDVDGDLFDITNDPGEWVGSLVGGGEIFLTRSVG